MKILLMAYECSPYQGSEWSVGWGRLCQAARVAETHVITSAENFVELQRARANGLLPENVFVHTPDLRRNHAGRSADRQRSDYDYRAYRHWQRRALQLARQQHALHCFDLVHQATVCTFREPGYAWKLGIPFVWGPFGGTQNFPLRMLPLLPWREAMYEAARGCANWLTLHCAPRVRSAGRHAAAILGANSTNAADCARTFHRPVEQLLETGLSPVLEPDRTRYHRRVAVARQRHVLPPLRLFWSGQLRSRKALPILLQALARVRDEVDFTLDVVGTGPESARWQAQAHALGLQRQVTFRGLLPLAQAVDALHTADVFCFTSLRDTSGNVVLEALAAGVPVIAFNHQGAAAMVNDSCGILLPVARPAAAIAAWAEAIRKLAHAPELLLRLSLGTTAQARRFSWDSNGDRVNDLYRQLTASQPARPQWRPAAHAPHVVAPGHA